MSITDDRPTTTCPSWCRADHEAEMQRRREMAAEVDRYLGVPPLRLVSSPMGELGQGFVVETYLLHTVEVGRRGAGSSARPVRTGMRVTVEQIEDVDGTAESTGLLVRIEEPPDWTEDYTPSEARELCRSARARRSGCTGMTPREAGHRLSKPGLYVTCLAQLPAGPRQPAHRRCGFAATRCPVRRRARDRFRRCGPILS